MKVRDLPIKNTVADDDLLYIVDDAAGVNGGRKLKASVLKAQLNLTDVEVKTAYENNADTNAFTDIEKLKLSELEAAGVSGGFNSTVWKSDASDQTAPPKDKRLEWNNLTQSNSTELFIDYDNKDGTDVSAFLALVIAGSHIRIQLKDNATVAQVFEVTGVVDNATYFTYTVVNVSSNGGNISDNKDILITFITASDLPDHASTHLTGGGDAIPVATVGVDGLMASGDKSKLNGIETGATQDAASGAVPPAVAATGSTGTDTNTYANANHTHAHGNQGGGTAHAAVTPTVNGFMTSVDKVKLNQVALGWVQYQSDTVFTQVGIGFTQMTDWTTNLDSFANSQLTRVSGTTFRVEQDCTVEISYNIEIDGSANNSGAEARVEVGAVQLDRSVSRGFARANINESANLTKTFRVDLTNQDLITFSIGSREASSIIALANNFTTMMIKVVRLP